MTSGSGFGSMSMSLAMLFEVEMAQECAETDGRVPRNSGAKEQAGEGRRRGGAESSQVAFRAF